MKKYLYPLLYIFVFLTISYIFQYYIYGEGIGYFYSAAIDVVLFLLGRSFNFGKGRKNKIFKKVLVILACLFLFVIQTSIISLNFIDVVLSIKNATVFVELLFIYFGFIF